MTSSPDRHTGDDGRRVPGAPSRRAALAGLGAGLLAGTGITHAGPQSRRLPGAPLPAGESRWPDVELLDHDGRRRHFYRDLLQGRIVVLNMMYAQCSDRCPPMTANLRQVHEALGERAGRDVFMYSITLRPEFDRPADLADYKARYRIGAGWAFLTGAPQDIERVRIALGFYDRDPAVDADIAQHTGMVRIGNVPLDRWCMTPALLEPEQICESIRAVDPHKRPIPARPAAPMALHAPPR